FLRIQLIVFRNYYFIFIYLIILMVDEQQQYEDYTRQAKEKVLSQYTTDVASLLSSLRIPNVSKPDDIQSIKQFVDQQQNQMKQQIGRLEESIRKLTRSLEKFMTYSQEHYNNYHFILSMNL
ncbi:hypothetical protein ACJX0J_020689, partial [Zea mays]